MTRRMSRDPERTTEAVIQKSARNAKLIILTENADPITAKQPDSRSPAFSMSRASVHLLESLRDLYIPQATKMKWERSSAKAKIAKFDTLVRIARNC